MICEKCKNTLPDDSEFCQFCGNRTTLTTSQPKTESANVPNGTLADEEIVEKMIAAGTHGQIFNDCSRDTPKKERRSRSKKRAIIIVSITLALVLLGVGGYFLVSHVIIPAQAYTAAEELYGKGDFAAAEAAFLELGDYSDAAERVLQCRDGQAISYVDGAKYNDLTTHIRVYGLSVPVQEHISTTALDAITQGDYATAQSLIPVLSEVPAAQDNVKEALYQQALVHYNDGEYVTSNDLFEYLGTYKDSNQKIHEHTFSVKTETAATCDKDGSTVYECSCGATESKPIKATGHDYSDATCKQPATCKVCGNSSGTTLNHNYSEATCTKAQTCSVCGTTDGSPLGHSLVDCVCSKCGVVKVSIEQLQGTWQVTTHSEIFGTETKQIVISGNSATVYEPSYTGDTIIYSGVVQLKDYGFYIEGTYSGVNVYGESYTAKISTRCYISKFSGNSFVDTFDDNGPYTWYKQ